GESQHLGVGGAMHVGDLVGEQTQARQFDEQCFGQVEFRDSGVSGDVHGGQAVAFWGVSWQPQTAVSRAKITGSALARGTPYCTARASAMPRRRSCSPLPTSSCSMRR